MKESTLARAISEVVSRGDAEGPLAEFVEAFFRLPSDEERYALIADAPALTGQQRIDALAGALGEYMAKHFCLPRVPRWVAERERYLDRPWHVIIFGDARSRPQLSTDEGFREFLTFSSPAEFCSRNIFTEQAPLPSRYYSRAEEKSRLQ